MENNQNNHAPAQNSAKAAIKSYLETRAADDTLFAVSYAKPQKSIDECFNYILNEACKRGTSVCMTDDEVFGLAVHYYDEDDIQVGPTPANFRASTSRKRVPTVELTEEEKAAVREAAIKQYEALCVAEEAERSAKRKKAEDERKRNENEQRKRLMATSPSLFDFDEI